MIAMLRGKLVARDGSRGVVDVQGVGWEVFAASRTLEDWERAGEATVHVSTQVREDSIQLFGFASDTERKAFEAVLGVEGFGPRLALATIEALAVPELHQAIEAGDVRILGKVPGVGPRKAQRLALELKGKLPVEFTVAAAAARARPAAAAEEDQLALALAQFQYGKSEIDRARAALAEQGLSDAPVEVRLSAALRVLGRGRS